LSGTGAWRPALSRMRLKLIAVIPVLLDGERFGLAGPADKETHPRKREFVEAVALLFDNMRWTLDLADYDEMKAEIGNVIDVTDFEEIPTRLH
jgi:hypothetical protein